MKPSDFPRIQSLPMGWTGMGGGMRAPEGTQARAIEGNLAALQASDRFKKSNQLQKEQMLSNVSRGLPADADPESWIPSTTIDPITKQPAYWALKGSGIPTNQPSATAARASLATQREGKPWGGGESRQNLAKRRNMNSGGQGATYRYAPRTPRPRGIPTPPTGMANIAGGIPPTLGGSSLPFRQGEYSFGSPNMGMGGMDSYTPSTTTTPSFGPAESSSTSSLAAPMPTIPFPKREEEDFNP